MSWELVLADLPHSVGGMEVLELSGNVSMKAMCDMQQSEQT